jgi:hypothetical protein
VNDLTQAVPYIEAVIIGKDLSGESSAFDCTVWKGIGRCVVTSAIKKRCLSLLFV